ncbi:hypothetical protein N0A02_33085 (plasmid) [Paraburkholderia acidicola]|uniref:Uncharacterized protein n=1 Tax=Paraburkholderia acidicola TaxID=1912599 RepID=A0ABV1LYB7_9BURK
MSTSHAVPFTPSHAEVLTSLRRVRDRPVVRHHHEATVDMLVNIGFVVWARSPGRLPALSFLARWIGARGPAPVAALTGQGITALSLLEAVEVSPHWGAFRDRPWDHSAKHSPS